MINTNSSFNCSFCGRAGDQVEHLIVGPVIPGTSIVACICAECAEFAFFQVGLMAAKKEEKQC